MVMLSKKSIVLAKIETTYGTDPTPGSTDVIEAIDATIKEVSGVNERNVQLKTLSSLASLSGEKYSEVTFKVELKGSGSVALAPRLDPLLQACALNPVIASGTSVTYSPLSSAIKSCTLYLYKDGRLHIITGARGTVKAALEAGKQAILEFSFKGLWVTPTVVALPTVSYETTVPAVCKGTAFTFNAKTTLVASKMDLDLANSLVQRSSMIATNAIAGFEITGRKPVLSFDVESQIETSYGFRADMLTTTRAVSYVVGSAAGNICTINVPKFNITNIEYSDKDGVLIEGLTGECSTSAAATGDDELTIVFT